MEFKVGDLAVCLTNGKPNHPGVIVITDNPLRSHDRALTVREIGHYIESGVQYTRISNITKLERLIYEIP